MAYTEMKSLSNKVKNVAVYYATPVNSEFRQYSIEVTDRIGEFRYVYQNDKPTIEELKDYAIRYYN
jgi:hypothetical protein